MLSFRYLLLASLGLSLNLAAFSAEKPNIILIMADDLGCDISPMVQSLRHRISTNWRGRAAVHKWILFGLTCTPTRYSLYGDLRVSSSQHGIAPPNSPALIQPGTETLASVLQSVGYETAVVGKWHLGLGGPDGPDWNGDLKPGPLEIGFDYSFLLPTTNDRVPQVYVRNHNVVDLDPSDPLWVGQNKPSEDHPTGITHRDTLKMDWTHGHNSTIHNGISRIWFYTGGHAARFRDEDLADKWVEESVKWIEQNKDSPFFLFFSSHDLHVPRIPHERFQGATSLGYRADVIVQLDWCVGEIMKTLKRLDLEEKTMIVFCSDNGPVMDDGYADLALENLETISGWTFSGGYSVYEGGTRTPFITWWKGRIQPGVSDEVCTIDLAASFASLTGAKLEDDACLDSIDVMDALLGKRGAKGWDHLVQQDNGRGGNYGFRWAREGSGTIQVGSQRAGETKLANTKVNQYRLFDLSKDPAEKNTFTQEQAYRRAHESRRKSSPMDAVVTVR